MVFTALLGSGFQRRTFPFLWVPELSPAPSCCSSQLAGYLQTLSLSLSRLSGSWSSLYGFGTDRTEDSSSVACVAVAAIKWRLLSYCLATGVFAEPFPSNGCVLASQFCISADVTQYVYNLQLLRILISSYSGWLATAFKQINVAILHVQNYICVWNIYHNISFGIYPWTQVVTSHRNNTVWC
jgi:hypothetical protein